jgi:hypothetical protein
MTGLIPDLTPGAVNNPLTTLSQLLTKVIDGIDNTLATGNTTDLPICCWTQGSLTGLLARSLETLELLAVTPMHSR